MSWNEDIVDGVRYVTASKASASEIESVLASTNTYRTPEWHEMYPPDISSVAVLLKLVYPFLNGFSSDPSRVGTVAEILNENTHITGYRPSVVLLANIEEQLNRLTWE